MCACVCSMTHTLVPPKSKKNIEQALGTHSLARLPGHTTASQGRVLCSLAAKNASQEMPGPCPHS